jgi:hypothetical protein
MENASTAVAPAQHPSHLLHERLRQSNNESLRLPRVLQQLRVQYGLHRRPLHMSSWPDAVWQHLHAARQRFANCGACGHVCSDPMVCWLGGSYPDTAPRLIAPTSMSIVTSQRPTLSWALASGTDGVHVQVCTDRTCAVPVAEFEGCEVRENGAAVGMSRRSGAGLASGAHAASTRPE